MWVVLVAQMGAAVLVLGPDIDLKWWSTTLQFSGALIASVGLGWSYLRATRFWQRRWPGIRARMMRILFGMPRPQNIVVGPMGATMGLFGFHAVAKVGYNLDRAKSMEEQITQLEHFINRLMNEEIAPINNEIAKLKNGLKEARELAESKAQEVLTTTRAEIGRLAMQLDRTQAFDIRWAIVGLFIAAVGTFLQYWA
ncbi:uncharacterized protein RMCFA_5015 [Mycolicibacterium fortuitum subsp. acetamidolyticum]|uniref:Transmembrane protein n=1 Tax=Mycolicibacterium fortuitum subsp. acetamidolyticum TaxID=144550 RepID=A0A100WVI3_MYCFO|nr:uncharacterized protein RMCFA_5015 [Mycolicibacterium fortuitum subsp. acetamidolyticum]